MVDLAASLEQVDVDAEWEVKLQKKELGLALKGDSQRVSAHVLALGQADLAALKAELEEKGSADVLGVSVQSTWVTISKV